MLFRLGAYLHKAWQNNLSHTALAGNRTWASRVAGENSTTEPPVLARNHGIIFEPNLLQPGLSALHTARKIRRRGKSRKANKLLSVVNPAQHASDNTVGSALGISLRPLHSTKSLIGG